MAENARFFIDLHPPGYYCAPERLKCPQYKHGLKLLDTTRSGQPLLTSGKWNEAEDDTGLVVGGGYAGKIFNQIMRGFKRLD